MHIASVRLTIHVPLFRLYFSFLLLGLVKAIHSQADRERERVKKRNIPLRYSVQQEQELLLKVFKSLSFSSCRVVLSRIAAVRGT